ncbi:MAG: hypothetical protein PHW04_00865 [Candidatus Wallbacteria bacterium]|nr:hypothetical protein [Candidatus Wallbacteria bacterium]
MKKEKLLLLMMIFFTGCMLLAEEAPPAAATQEAAITTAASVETSTAAPVEAAVNAPAAAAPVTQFAIDKVKNLVIKSLESNGVKDWNLEQIEGQIKTYLQKGSVEAEIVTQLSADFTNDYQKKHRMFNPELGNLLVALLVIAGFVGFYITSALKGQDLYVRPIAGLSAIDEAVGRATEMGREVMFVPGIYDMDDLPTIAAISILGHIAKKTAEYDTEITVPVAGPIVFSTAKEVIKEAHLKVGRPDTYKEDCVRYIANDQFSYAAGVCGKMIREKPATIFYLGTFYAESLVLAETGNSIKAIQIAGTTMPSQLPFFVAACDYTIIGEELYAASAYFSREPMQLGSLKGQDAGKLIVMISIVIGVIMTSIAKFTGTPWFDFFKDLFQVKN